LTKGKRVRVVRGVPAPGLPHMGTSGVKKTTRPPLFSAWTTLVFIFLSCGEPYYFPASSWEIKGIPPGGCVAMANRKNAVFLVKGNIIFKFDGDAFTEDYAGRESVQFYDIAFFGNDGWAVGCDTEAEKPFIVRNAGGGWKELIISEPGLYCFTQVIPVGARRCWFVAPEPVPNSLFLWDGARLKLMAGGAPVKGGCYDRSNDVLYIYRPKSQGEWELLITADGGKSWTLEKIPTALGGFYLNEIPSWGAAGGALYFAASPSPSGPGSSVLIIKRSGGAAPGDYNIIFRSPLGPNFRDVKDIALNDLGSGVAVGDDSTVVLSTGRVYIEESPDVQFKLVTPDSTDGFWALASDPVGLYYGR
jgi:hypothetical protein